MATRRLAKSMRVRDPATGESVLFLAGTVPPQWAQEAITNPVAWGDTVEPEPAEKPAQTKKKTPAKKRTARKKTT